MTTSTEDKAAYIARVTKAIDEAKTIYEITQEKIADHLGLNHTSVSLFKRDRPLPQRYIKKFCDITRVRIEWLISGTGPMRHDAWVQDKLAFLHKLDEKEQSRFDALVSLTFGHDADTKKD